MQNTTKNVSDQNAQKKLLDALEAFRSGDFSVQIDPKRGEGEMFSPTPTMKQIYGVFNEIAQQQQELVREVKACNRAAGDGNLSLRAKYTKKVPIGGWWEILHQVNRIMDQVELRTSQTRRALESLARGDLSAELALCDDRGEELGGDYAKIAESINEISAKSDLIAWEISKMAKEMGIEGKLGIQIPWTGDLDGRWKLVAEDLNLMSRSVAERFRSIGELAAAIACGDYSKRIEIPDIETEASAEKGEMLELIDGINKMAERLSNSKIIPRINLETLKEKPQEPLDDVQPMCPEAPMSPRNESLEDWRIV